ncbi:MAG: hypothetical protein WC182_02175 [Bacilli bacterium]|jgi:hypothetical protein
MGLLMNLPKENNSMYLDFLEAYWAIGKISFGSNGGDGSVMCSFNFSAYPNRDSKKATEALVEPSIMGGFGGPLHSVVDSCLYRWTGLFRASDIFPTGIPTTSDEQLALLYPFVKQYLNLVDVVDVLEDA